MKIKKIKYYGLRRESGLGYQHIDKDSRICRMYGKELIDEIELSVADNQKRKQIGYPDYWGWLEIEAGITLHKVGEFHMVYPSLVQCRVCFPYGPEAEEKLGRGKLLRLDVKTIKKDIKCIEN